MSSANNTTKLLSPLPPPPSTPSSSNNTTNKWGPFSSAKDFDTNMALMLLVLVCALLLLFSLHFSTRLFLRRRHSNPSTTTTQNEKPQNADSPPPSLVFSAGMKLAGAEAECAICLSEFEEGDAVRILPFCKHGFHVSCIEKWLSSRSSCPTCRTSCRPAAELPVRSPVEP